MNLKKTLAIWLSSLFLAAFSTLLGGNASAQSISIRSGQHALQTGVSQSFDPAAPVKPLRGEAGGAGWWACAWNVAATSKNVLKPIDSRGDL